MKSDRGISIPCCQWPSARHPFLSLCFRSFYSCWFPTLYNAAFPPCSSEECLCRSPLCNPRYGRLCRSNGSPLHAAPCWSFDRCRNNTVFRSMRHPTDRCSGTYRLSSVSFLSGPIASWANGDTFSFVPACIYSGRSQGRKSPPFCLPGRPLFIPPEPLFPLYHPFPPLLSPAGRPYSSNRCAFMFSPDAFWPSPVWFYRCKYRPSRLSLTF